MHVSEKMMLKGSKEALTVLIMATFCFFQLFQHRIFHTTLQHSIQHAHTLDLANKLFPHTSFWREKFLNISNHLPDS